MNKIAIICFLVINSSFLFAQTSLTIEGTNVNNTETGDWGGVNIQRNAPTSLIYHNNSIASSNSSGYMLQAGDEGIGSTNNNLNGALISGNKLTWNGSPGSSITHGIFLGYNINYLVKYNYLDKCPYGILPKSGDASGSNMAYTTNGIGYNIVKNAKISTNSKSMDGVHYYNNTFYNVQYDIGKIIELQGNNAQGTVEPVGIKIKNNIFYTKYVTCRMISIESTDSFEGFESDYNIFWSEDGAPTFEVAGVTKTFAEWQALGYDRHSLVIDPNFNNITDFVPASRLNFGTDLGSAWQTGLSTTAVWTVGTSPMTTDQNGAWQVGARVYSGNMTVTNPVFVSSVVENATPSLLEMTYNQILANIAPANTAFNVLVNSVNIPVNSVVINGNKIQLKLASPIKYGDIVTVSYTKPVTNPLQTSLGGFAGSMTGQLTINNLIKPAQQSPVTIRMTISPNHAHKIINVLLAYTGSLSAQTETITPEIIRIFDLSGNLFFEKLLVTGVSSLKIPLNLDPGIYTVLMIAGGLVMDSQKMVVY